MVPLVVIAALLVLWIVREQLMRALANHGEALSPEDLAQCLRALTGHDDLESLDQLSEYVGGSKVVVVFLTAGYISAPNCRREL